MNALVTGGAGFIGSHLVDALLAAGHTVRVLDDFSTGRASNLAGVRGEIETVHADARDLAAAAAACAGVETVFHLAAIPSVAASFTDPVGVMSANFGSLLTVLEAARGAGVRRIVFASSSAVYGGAGEQPRRESMPPAPESPYASSKLIGELQLDAWRTAFGLETVALRFFNVFGPRLDPESPYAAVLALIARAIRDGAPFTVNGDGEQTRDFVPVSDVAAACLAAAAAADANGRVFNVGTGVETSVTTALATMMEIAGREIPVRHIPGQPWDVRRSVADISRLTALGWRPAAGFRAGCQALLAEALA
ncbi:MAG: NAD-dependent epimerase/dehydratase family protein [Chloroflexota bacterium]